MFTNYGMT